MPPAPSPEHQDFGWTLESWLRNKWAKQNHGRVFHDVNVASVGTWPNDYRIPDLIVLTDASQAVQKDVYFEGPPDIVAEIRSPEDESFEKLSFYADLGVREVWILDRDTKVPTLYILRNGHYETKAPQPDGWLLSEVTGIELRSMQPGKLSIRLQGDRSTHEDIP